MEKLGTLKVSPATEYERTGYVIEEYGYANFSEPTWYVPGWFEDNYGESGFFDTEQEANEFLELVSY